MRKLFNLMSRQEVKEDENKSSSHWFMSMYEVRPKSSVEERLRRLEEAVFGGSIEDEHK